MASPDEVRRRLARLRAEGPSLDLGDEDAAETPADEDEETADAPASVAGSYLKPSKPRRPGA